MTQSELKEFLDAKVIQYNNPKFIESDPIQIPHQFTLKQDIEISAFLTATIAWGNRKMIIKNAQRIMDLVGNSPYDFVINHKEEHLDRFGGFVHRTFNEIDIKFFIQSLKYIYLNNSDLEAIFYQFAQTDSMQYSIHQFKSVFFQLEHPKRVEKHISDPLKGSASKRINMFLRWMVRNDNAGVDFGIWKTISSSQLSCPLDVHSGKVARKLGLLNRTQNDAKALLELDTNLRKLDATDPVKYDFALFGLGIFEKF